MYTSIKLFKESLENNLTIDQKIELINDFKEWSGGALPNEMNWNQEADDVEADDDYGYGVLDYITGSIIIDTPAARKFIEDLYDGVENASDYI